MFFLDLMEVRAVKCMKHPKNMFRTPHHVWIEMTMQSVIDMKKPKFKIKQISPKPLLVGFRFMISEIVVICILKEKYNKQMLFDTVLCIFIIQENASTVSGTSLR